METTVTDKVDLTDDENSSGQIEIGGLVRRAKKYNSYDPRVKVAIAATGRIDLFPDLEVPRTTALEWIRQGYTIDDPILDSIVEAFNQAVSERDDLAKKLAEASAIIQLLKEVFGILGFRLRWKHVDSGKVKEKILAAITKAMGTARRDSCLNEIGLSLSRYKRWKREKRGCGLGEIKSCPRNSVNQLTFNEISKMRALVESKEFSHYPIRSLHYYAKRENLLFCSYSTWRKYIDQYGWKRPRKAMKPKKRLVGIRAEAPNEIWHLDVSHFILPDRSKVFIQAVVDNYSRYVLAWQVLASYDGSRTANLLKKALNKKYSMNKRSPNLRLIVDGGSENKGKKIKNLEGKGKFKKQVARFEISFSNSIVETIFRSLKRNYLFHKKIKSFSSLKWHCRKWFVDHNEHIPHTSFSGETPLERMNNQWSDKDLTRILVNQQAAIQLRVGHNQKVFCEMCDVA